MNWDTLTEREPELVGVERACRACRQRGADWHDFLVVHVAQLTRLVGRVPVVTMHDAVYTSTADVDTVEAAFNDVFTTLGFRLALKTERT